MANIRINALPSTTSVVADDYLPMDGATTRKIKPSDILTAVRPFATQAEAEAGVVSTDAMSPLLTKQAIDAQRPASAAGLAVLVAANAAAQRTALGLGDAATKNVGDTAGTVAAGDDPRFGGLGTLADQGEAEAGVSNSKLMSPLRTKQAIDYQRPASAAGLTVLAAADAAAQRTAIGATAAGSAMLTAANVAAQTALLNQFAGDVGSGGTKGMVPAPGSGDGAAGKFLRADGGWAVPAGSVQIAYNAVADGGCDNTGGTTTGAAVQAAIDAATTAGRPCYFPPGTYDITGTRIRPPSGARIVGAGYLKSVFRRTTNTNTGTVECYGVTDVEVRGIGISYTNASGTIGYAQTGFCARNGSRDIRFIDCGVVGRMNRGFHILNSRDVYVIRCYALGCSNAALRVVSDFNASAVADMSDETSPVQVWNAVIDGCHFNGAETATGSTQYSPYGINLAGENGGSDQVIRCRIINCLIQNFDAQGLEMGGKVFDCKAAHINIHNCGDGGGGFGALFQLYNGNGAFGCVMDDITVSSCGVGVAAYSATYSDFIAVMSRSNAGDGFYAQNCIACQWIGTKSLSNSGDGYDVTNVDDCNFEHVIGSVNTGIGFRADGTSDSNALNSGLFRSNTAGAFSIAWTNASGTSNRNP